MLYCHFTYLLNFLINLQHQALYCFVALQSIFLVSMVEFLKLLGLTFQVSNDAVTFPDDIFKFLSEKEKGNNRGPKLRMHIQTNVECSLSQAT